MGRLWVAGTIVAVVWGSAANLLAAPPAPSPADLLTWLKQLDDDSYAVREQASQNLLAAGESAIDALAAGVLSRSPEAAWRAGETLKQIAIHGNEQQLDRVAIALERLEKSGKSGMRQVVAEIRGRQKQTRHDKAAAQIRQLGGGLVGGGEGFAEDLAFAPAIMAAPMIAVDFGGEVAVEAEAADEVERVEARLKETLEDLLKEGADLKGLDKGEAGKLRELVKDLFGDVKLPAVAAPPGEKDLAPAPPAAGGKPADLAPLPVPLEIAAAPEVVGEAVPVELPLGDAEIVAADAFFMIDADGGLDADPGMQISEALTLDGSWRGGDQGLRAIRDLPDITSIEIRGAKLTDAALNHIAALPRLQRVHVQGTKFSSQALRKFREAHPHTTLFCQGEAMLGVHCDTTGACVLTSVYYGSGAFEAGLQDGDRIVAVDGQPVADFSDLTIAVYPHVAGDKLPIEFERGTEKKTVTVTLKPRNVIEKRSE